MTGKEHQLCSHLKWLREYVASAPKCTDGWNGLPTLSGTPPSGYKKEKIDLENVDLRMNEKKIKTRVRIINLKLEGFDKGIWRTFKAMRIHCINT